MMKLDYTKSLIKLSSFEQVWKSLTESQQKLLFPYYFEISNLSENIK